MSRIPTANANRSKTMPGLKDRTGTCCTSECCDYCIAGDRNPIASEYELKTAENGLWISERKK
ncbi:MAG: hypothetical protein IKE18_00015 [Oscillospiraceae bacterium]|nr:hypothetical protein [Oscillospiraceae bacterium]